MSDPTQVEPTVPAGSGDADYDAAMAEAVAESPAIEPVEPPSDSTSADPVLEPTIDPDVTYATLENGEREIRTATGQVYRGKDDAELAFKVAKAQVSASRKITEDSRKIAELSRSPESSNPVQQQVAPAIDPTALAIADLMAPAFGVKNGAELVAAFAKQQEAANSSQEFMAAQQANYEAANFFRAVPEFSKSQGDADKIDQFLQRNSLPFNAQTAEMAYYTLKAKGEMTVAPATTRASTPKNAMPAPPSGTSPANTGKGAPTEAELYSMTTDQLAELLGVGGTQ
jgi:hypothetical protein